MRRAWSSCRWRSKQGALLQAGSGVSISPATERLTDFWSTVLLGTKEFQGNVFGTHMQLQGVAPEHFRRWLDIFAGTVTRLFEPEVADEFMVVARRIAGSLQYGFFGKIHEQ